MFYKTNSVFSFKDWSHLVLFLVYMPGRHVSTLSFEHAKARDFELCDTSCRLSKSQHSMGCKRETSVLTQLTCNLLCFAMQAMC